MSRFYNILIVDDSKTIVHYLLDILNDKEHNLLYTFSKEEAKKIIGQNEIDILICDLMLPDVNDGLETVRFFKQIYPDSKVLGISSHSNVDNVVTMIKEGADDFVPKTSTKDQIIRKIESLKSIVVRSNGKADENGAGSSEEIIVSGGSDMQVILDRMQIVAENQVETCLISGESGTGKELVARTIHRLSPRKDKPFLALNCAGMPDSLIDSELFGFERGSFTGAYSTTQGKFELADKGILFLDEISEMPIHLQGKLLRVLENREVLRIGGKKNIPVDVMILAATNRNLEEEIEKGNFREDIYYRLTMVKIDVPPLRERGGDIRLLAEHFLQTVNVRLGKNIKIPEETFQVLESYHFPGNVRELKNIIYSAALFAKGNVVKPAQLRTYLKSNGHKSKTAGNGDSREAADRETIIATLKRNDGNITNSARELGYTREGLSRRLKKLDIDKEDFK